MNIVIVIIRNSRDKYFIHQRISDKRTTFHNLFGLGIGGGVKPKEEITHASQRELKEEAGISAIPTFLFKMDMKHIGLSKIVHAHELIYDGDIKNCDEEWQWSGWMIEEEINNLTFKNKLCPDTAEIYKKYKTIRGKMI